MGEYARTANGDEIKVGTCEDMYYLRADQRHLISGYSFDAGDRFRFPFPDEDENEPGQFDDHDRGVRIPGWELPSEFADGHSTVQFTSSAGYVLSIPCPEQFGQPGWGVDLPNGLHVGRNGFHGHPVVKQQKQVGEELVTIIACGACGAKWRLSKSEAANVAETFLNEVEREEYRPDLNGFGPANSDRQRAFLTAMADRIMAGYRSQVEA